MTLKPLDLQISVPRTQEFSTMQGQAQHKPVSDQEKIAMQQAKQLEAERARSASIEETAELRVKDEQRGSQSDRRSGEDSAGSGQGNGKQENQEQAGHPYKGKRIDFKI